MTQLTDRQLANREDPNRWDSLDAQASAPSFGRRHYVALAEMVRDYGYPADQKRLAEHMVRYLSKTNRAFNRERFLRACGVES